MTFTKKILVPITIFYAMQANAQDYLISFTGNGASNMVNTVLVDNLTSGTTLTINGDEILRLTAAVGIPSSESSQPSLIKIYPNPAKDYSLMEIFPPSEGETTITIYDIIGKPIFQTRKYLEKYLLEFRMTGMGNGCYLIDITGIRYRLSGKFLCTGQSGGKTSIEEVDNIIQTGDERSQGFC